MYITAKNYLICRQELQMTRVCFLISEPSIQATKYILREKNLIDDQILMYLYFYFCQFFLI
jgi:hypothetical protein